MFNNKMKRKYHHNEPNDLFKDFVAENASIIESIKENSNDLTQFLSHLNDNIL